MIMAAMKQPNEQTAAIIPNNMLTARTVPALGNARRVGYGPAGDVTPPIANA
jgi:hypothetical protein